MEVHLQTTKFCIETAARKEYESILKQYFKHNNEQENRSRWETQIQGLTVFLEQFDMKALRSLYPELDKGGMCNVVLRVDPTGQEVTLFFNGQSMIPPRKPFP